jgi:hypothetical protein
MQTPRLPDGKIIKEYVHMQQPCVVAYGHVSLVELLTDGKSFLFHIYGYEELGEGEFFCSVHDTNPLYTEIIEGAMITLDGVYDGIMLKDIQRPTW